MIHSFKHTDSFSNETRAASEIAYFLYYIGEKQYVT